MFRFWNIGSNFNSVVLNFYRIGIFEPENISRYPYVKEQRKSFLPPSIGLVLGKGFQNAVIKYTAECFGELFS